MIPLFLPILKSCTNKKPQYLVNTYNLYILHLFTERVWIETSIDNIKQLNGTTNVWKSAFKSTRHAEINAVFWNSTFD